jgi:hypothetical protein
MELKEHGRQVSNEVKVSVSTASRGKMVHVVRLVKP